MRKLLFIYVLGLFCLNQTFAQSDSVLLTFEQYYQQVLNNHPMARAANLLPLMAKQEVRTARGSFDPTINIQADGKQTKGINSFEYIEPSVKIPTLIGVDIKAGMDQSSGVSVDPERAKYNPQTGQTEAATYQLFYGGVNIPVLRGLFTDVRRTALNQAKLLVALNDAEQIKELNKLFLNAAKDYWDWQMSYEQVRLMQTGYNLAATRLDFVTNRIKGGEEKPIDSVEALIEVQRRQAMLVDATLAFKNKTIQLSNNLWDANQQPVVLADKVYPSVTGSEVVFISSDSLSSMVNFAAQNHPEIVKLRLKVKQFSFERKLALEFIKPQLDFEYYPFQTYTNGNSDGAFNFFGNNYKYGLTFKSSLFLRKERGKLQLTNYKLSQSNLSLQQGQRDIANNVVATYNQLQAMEQQLSLQTQLLANTLSLRNAEEYRFENGESSLFLVNQRERAYIEAQNKLVEARAKYAKAKHELQWSSGRKLF